MWYIILSLVVVALHLWAAYAVGSTIPEARRISRKMVWIGYVVAAMNFAGAVYWFVDMF